MSVFPRATSTQGRAEFQCSLEPHLHRAGLNGSAPQSYLHKADLNVSQCSLDHMHKAGLNGSAPQSHICTRQGFGVTCTEFRPPLPVSVFPDESLCFLKPVSSALRNFCEPWFFFFTVITAYPCGHDAGETIQNLQTPRAASLFRYSLGPVSWSLPPSFSSLTHIYWPFRARSKTTFLIKIFFLLTGRDFFLHHLPNLSGIYHFLLGASVTLCDCSPLCVSYIGTDCPLSNLVSSEYRVGYLAWVCAQKYVPAMCRAVLWFKNPYSILLWRADGMDNASFHMIHVRRTKRSRESRQIVITTHHVS